MSITIRPVINVNTVGVALKINSAAEKAVPHIADDIRENCNYYAPERQHTLIQTSNTESYSANRTDIHWGVPYASYVYKGVSKRGRPLKYSKDLNPNAQAKWCRKAKQMKLSQWKKQAAKYIKDNYNEQ